MYKILLLMTVCLKKKCIVKYSSGLLNQTKMLATVNIPYPRFFLGVAGFSSAARLCAALCICSIHHCFALLEM